jgi:hemerythrin-like metal-binding protein
VQLNADTPPFPSVEGFEGLLVVDDDPIHRRIIGKIAAQAGYQVLFAASVEEAVTVLGEGKIHCMTVDIDLGERNGVELLNIIGETAPDVYVIVISGAQPLIFAATEKLAKEHGVKLFDAFRKPLDLASLRNSLVKLRQICWGEGRLATESGQAPGMGGGIQNEKSMMILWKYDFAIDHGCIDSDHQNIIERINEINILINVDGGIHIICNLMSELYRVAVAHFFREESLQAISSFPQSGEHKAEHERLLHSLNEWVSTLGSMTHSDDLCLRRDMFKKCRSFLYRWILSHILIEDKKMCEYVHAMQSANETLLTTKLNDLVTYVDTIMIEREAAFAMALHPGRIGDDNHLGDCPAD